MPSKAAKKGAPTWGGEDSKGVAYATVQDMWKAELAENTPGGQKTWYTKAVQYWDAAPPTVNGVLGGFEVVSDPDLRETRQCLDYVHQTLQRGGPGRAADIGCGIGRVTKAVLQELYTPIDLLEPCQHMLSKAQEALAPDKMGEAILGSLQDWQPPPHHYACIFIQWATLYLTDSDLVNTLTRCQAALTENGVIFLKENITRDDRFHIDKEDSSITRCDAQYLAAFKEAGVEVVHHQMQKDWPDDLFPLKMYVLK
eukprot:NODE_1383_length_983_cov_45.997859_g1066_i0.p1 GENE.NODE_1383_length_983_cov_45.997859_g1066_i0~~NODE_1383_length_983_cov_45.997859_g1066_i0.p1  ORF type:complete len:274 (+),score=100.06 NODE_1383_length_983_cov_45.997859_g1066_i0:58-822(+)